MAEELQQQDSQEQLETPTSNKRIAKNALMLYIRMFLTMIVGLYTSRVVLATLGVEDYGIYGVVGGVVAMMGFLNASMSGATSRFLTFELGRGNQKRLAETFSSALIVHIGIALIVFVLAETVGLWFLCNKLVIPAGRMNAAHWVYQCSILSAMLGITQAPYNASIIAHEKMDVYAYVEILNVSLKLLIVYLLVIGNFDKLKLYAVLVLAVSVLIMLIYRIYCIRKFKETHFHWIWKKEYLKPLLSFSGWDLYGNMSVNFYHQGVAFIINVFFGAAINAANTVAINVNGIIKSFAYNVIQAFRPPIIKEYAKSDVLSVEHLLITSSICSLMMLFVVFIPVFFEGNYLLSLWLVEVPNESLFFLQIIMVSCIFNVANLIINIPIHATGKIKKLSLYTGTFYLLCPFIMYIMLKIGVDMHLSYGIIIPTYLITLSLSLIILKKELPSIRISKLLIAYFKCTITILVCSLFAILIKSELSESFIRLCIITLGCLLLLSFFLLVFIGKNERKIIFKKINKIKK